MGLDSLLAIMETRNVTPVETADVTPEPAWIKACTPVTSVTPQNGIAANEPAEISFDLEAFEERAAIMEFDGGLPRAEAERAARLIVYTTDDDMPASCWDTERGEFRQPAARLSATRLGAH